MDWILFNCAMKAWQTAFSESKGTWHGLSFTRAALGFVLFIALIHFFLALKGPGRQFKGSSSFLKASCFLSSWCSFWCRFFKVQILWEGHKIWKNLPPILKSCFYSVASKLAGNFFKIPWPFQKSLTLQCLSLSQNEY